MFRKSIMFLILSNFSTCLKHLILAPVSLSPPSGKAQSALIGQVINSIVIGQLLPAHVGNDSICSCFT